MLTYEIEQSNLHQVKPLDHELICEEIEQLTTEAGLTMSQRTTLSSKKGSYHWHFKKGKEKGVLEITYWPKHHRLWLDIHDNRRAPWNIEAIKELAVVFTHHFGGTVVTNDEGGEQDV
ncbi:hypothetical protein [Thalassobacillus sp. CUG 92003]|uniref:hypothetical protein n=1 Tax=Thalassobacillus sp. CUG 92003 TaxID=2736641 RepID=UPI0015E6AC10|nr:hypothetical protein [Thalassobacillus sp. CUG 92003]